MTIKELTEKLQTETVTDLSAANALLADMMEEEAEEIEKTEEETEEVSEEAEETEEPAEEQTEEVSEEEVSEEVSEEAEEPAEEEQVEPEQAEENTIALSAVTEYIKSLRDENETLKKRLEDVESKLSAKTKAEADFFSMFSNLTASVAEEQKETFVPHQIGMTNGIGEL